MVGRTQQPRAELLPTFTVLHRGFRIVLKRVSLHCGAVLDTEREQ